jgi:phosphoribosylanthranilate isomerase
MTSQPKPPRIKFCGFTRQQDLADAIDLEVDAIGLNFYPKSKRYVEPAMAKRLSSLIQGCCMRVGIFVDATPEQIDRVLSVCPLDAIQLHGQESVEWLMEFENSTYWPGLPILKALAYRGPLDDPDWTSWVQECSNEHSSVIGMLVDAYDPIEKGGTGKRANWGLLRPRPLSFLKADGSSAPLLLAGGLNPSNLAEALDLVEPCGIDVASGIESSPGIKDPVKMKSMVQAVRNYATSR